MIKSSDQKNEYDEVENKIFASFKKYIESVKSKFQDNNNSKVIKHLKLYHSDNNIKIEELENEQEFSQLLDDTMKIKSPFVDSNIIFKNHERFFWKSPIENFFRRSSCYLDIINKRDIDLDLLFNDYLKSFRKEKTQIKYFALVESVYFNKKIMDFGSYKICRFNESELNTIFSRKINEMFYPFAVIDSKKLQNYWFIYTSENNTFTKFSFDIDNKVKFEHSMFAKPIELTVKKFSLFDWQADFGRDSNQEDKWWMAPQIPYVFSVNDNLLNNPSPIYFDYRQLATEPFFDPYTNEEIGEKPDTIFHLGEEFEKFMLQIEYIFNNNGNINFINNALGHFIKAFFSQGIEQLLWHIFTIEALLGSKEPGLTDRLAKRSEVIIAKEQKNNENIYTIFKKLYDYRSELVHGRSSLDKNSPNTGHLYTARDIARRIILWFLYYISHNIKDLEKLSSKQIQKKIFTTIDPEIEKISNNINT